MGDLEVFLPVKTCGEVFQGYLLQSNKSNLSLLKVVLHEKRHIYLDHPLFLKLFTKKYRFENAFGAKTR